MRLYERRLHNQDRAVRVGSAEQLRSTTVQWSVRGSLGVHERFVAGVQAAYANSHDQRHANAIDNNTHT